MLWSDYLCPPPQIHMLKSYPPPPTKNNGIKRWVFRSCLGHESGDLMDEISSLLKGVSLLLPLCENRHIKKASALNQIRGLYDALTILVP